MELREPILNLSSLRAGLIYDWDLSNNAMSTPFLPQDFIYNPKSPITIPVFAQKDLIYLCTSRNHDCHVLNLYIDMMYSIMAKKEN